MATLTTTLPSAVQAGKPIAVAFVGAASGVSDSAGNVYTLALTVAGRQIWTCKAPPAHATAPLITVTLSSASGRMLLSQHPVTPPPDWA